MAFRFLMDVFTGGSYSDATAAISSGAKRTADAVVNTSYAAADAAKSAATKAKKTVKGDDKERRDEVVAEIKRKQLERRGIEEIKAFEVADAKRLEFKQRIEAMLMTLGEESFNLSQSHFFFLFTGKFDRKQAKITALSHLMRCTTLTTLQREAKDFLGDPTVGKGLFSHRVRDLLWEIVNAENPTKGIEPQRHVSFR